MKPPFKPRDPRSAYSEANVITVLRLLGSMTFFVLAVVRRDRVVNFIGLGIYWLGNVLAGFCAQKARQEIMRSIRS